jgi:hypothetical protein
MNKFIRWVIGGVLLSSFMILSLMLMIYSFTPIGHHDYQWHITIPALVVLLVSGISIVPKPDINK